MTPRESLTVLWWVGVVVFLLFAVAVVAAAVDTVVIANGTNARYSDPQSAPSCSTWTRVP